jgi:hypothetical protein
MFDFMFESVHVSLPLIVWALLFYMGLGILVTGVVLLATTSQLAAQRKRALKRHQENDFVRPSLDHGERTPVRVEQLIVEEVLD